MRSLKAALKAAASCAALLGWGEEGVRGDVGPGGKGSYGVIEGGTSSPC